jgi:hypothetical protein
MGDTRIKIDFSQGFIEAEGNEAFVKTIYADFKEKFQAAHGEIEKHTKAPKKARKPKDPSDSKPKKVKSSVSGDAPKIVTDLDLSGGKDKPSLRTFYAQYAPNTNYEKNLIFCYYLKNILEIPKASINHVFTCYRDIKTKAPTALAQSLRDTAKDKGWINASFLEDIQVPIAGTNFLEHDLQKASTESEK